MTSRTEKANIFKSSIPFKWMKVLGTAVLVAGCANPPSRIDGVAQNEVVLSSNGENFEVPLSASDAKGQSCTEEWRRRGHTNQNAAKAFLSECLSKQGVVTQRLDRTSVVALLQPMITSGSDLTLLVPANIDTYCPRYSKLDGEGRATFWRELLAVMTGPESNYVSTTGLWETGGLNQFSIGLLQLSYTDAGGYDCDFKNEADIADPVRNLSCAVKIMTRRVSQSGSIDGRSGRRWLGGAAYWSVLRSTSDSRPRIIQSTSRLSVCSQR